MFARRSRSVGPRKDDDLRFLVRMFFGAISGIQHGIIPLPRSEMFELSSATMEVIYNQVELMKSHQNFLSRII